MQHSEVTLQRKKIKHGAVPGDISKRMKIAMKEKKTPVRVSSYQTITDTQAKTWRKVKKLNEKAVLKRRTREELKTW